MVVRTEVYANSPSSDVAVTISATVDSPRAHRTFMSLSSAWVSVMDLFGGMKVENFVKPIAVFSHSLRRTTNNLVSRRADDKHFLRSMTSAVGPRQSSAPEGLPVWR